MWNHKYGKFSEDQEKITKKYMQKQIYFLLLCVDENTKEDYKDVDVLRAFNGTLTWFGGLNEILGFPPQLVKVMCLLEAARLEYLKKDEFDFRIYRKLVLDAGAEVMKIEEVV